MGRETDTTDALLWIHKGLFSATMEMNCDVDKIKREEQLVFRGHCVWVFEESTSAFLSAGEKTIVLNVLI